MREGQSRVTYLKDYQPPAYLIDSTRLEFDIREGETLVTSTLAMRKNPQSESTAALSLHGEQLELKSLAVDGKALSVDDYTVTDKTLGIASVPDNFELCCVTSIDPSSNLSLEGLYLSDGMYCTQCEAEGFRRITYYLDRPDVMSVFTVRITADAGCYPVLLSNGNEVARGVVKADENAGEIGRHWVEWHDPFKKPAYLFALVAGNLSVVEDSFTTQSGRQVLLQVYVEAKDIDKTAHAMLSLKNAMRWDEEVYGREYDLDRYMIVAVDFFNMGAMENKGLNIFNTSCVLAHAQTQSDLAFQRVEAVIAHEYFHNWSGNRVTCRDWFQLSLKEGFTVFRDSQFSSDMNSATVKRIEDVNVLRSAQFAEDAGPMSHPVRPESYIEISNFYTLTIYEKGAEVIRMMQQILGADKFRAGSDLYFQRHDGQAVTCEDFVCAMEDASGVNLQQFRLWYSQSGTPGLVLTDSWDADTGSWTLTVEQNCPATPGQPDKKPFYIPLKMALLKPGKDGAGIEEQPAANEKVIAITDTKQQFGFSGLAQKPVPSLLRGFSAPVKLHFDYSFADLLQLIRHDDDGFTRWDASRRYLFYLLQGQMDSSRSFDSTEGKEALDAYCAVVAGLLDPQLLADKATDLALLAEIVGLPGYQFIIEQMHDVDMGKLHEAMESLREEYCSRLQANLLAAYQGMQELLSQGGEYQPLAADIAKRSLKNICLGYLVDSPDKAGVQLASKQFASADNMTDLAAALGAMVNARAASAEPAAAAALDEFFQRYVDESLVVNQWLTLQASSTRPDTLDKVKALMTHEAYDETNPNKVRALIGAFCMRNLPCFHAADGSGYSLLADEVIRLDALNPQLASRLLAPLTQWAKYAEQHRSLMFGELQRISQVEGLSADVYEVVSKSLAG